VSPEISLIEYKGPIAVPGISLLSLIVISFASNEPF
jgi:hypothetical protein